MQATQHPVTDEAVTPARTLRVAGLYLLRHGWHQGDMFADPDQPTPPACAAGAIRMAVIGTPIVAADHCTARNLSAFDQAVGVLADHLVMGYGVRDVLVLPDVDPETIVTDWNDQTDRIASHVIAAMYGAADAWDRIHRTAPNSGDASGKNAVCFCAGGRARSSMADPGAFGFDCECWCHENDPFDGRRCPTYGSPLRRMEPVGPCRHLRSEVPA